MNDSRFEYKVIPSHVQSLQSELRNQKEPAGHWIRDYVLEKIPCQPQRKGSQAKQDSGDKPLKAKASANGSSELKSNPGFLHYLTTVWFCYIITSSQFLISRNNPRSTCQSTDRSHQETPGESSRWPIYVRLMDSCAASWLICPSLSSKPWTIKQRIRFALGP